MSYDPTTDFIGLLRLTSGTSVRSERMPGLDWMVAALNRMGLFALSVGQSAPTVNKPTTVWLKPAIPSWSAEGTIYLWDAVAAAYAVATPALWTAFLAAIVNGYSFQSVAVAGPVNILAGTTLLAVQRDNPVTTSLVLPGLGAQWATGKPVQVVDFSTNVVNHTIQITTPDGATIMQLAQWSLLSTAVQLSGITLWPSPDLNSWVIAP